MTHPTAAERYRAHMEATTARNRFLAVAGAILFVLAMLGAGPLMDLWNGR